MNNEELKEIGKQILNNEKLMFKELPEDNAIYMWEDSRGGRAIIIGTDKTYLVATSCVNFEDHLNQFRNGKRNMKYLKRDVFINCVPNIIWKKDLTKKEIIEALNKYKDELNSHNFEQDNDFIMDHRRTHMIERINTLTQEEEKEALYGADNMLWSFWEFISEEYHGTLNKEAQKRGISVKDAENIWNKYKEKGIICLQEKEYIEDIIEKILLYISNTNTATVQSDNINLKELVEEVIGNNDPYWNIPVLDVVKKIIDLPENSELTISELIDSDNKVDSKFMFEINKLVTEVCKKINITLDKSNHSGQFIGLPFNISFVKKTLSDEVVNSIPESLKDYVYIHNGNIYAKQKLPIGLEQEFESLKNRISNI